MKQDTQFIIVAIVFAFAGIVSLAYIGYANAQVKEIDSIPIKNNETISQTDTRKAFGYCPIDSDTQTVLTKYGVNYTIESCPLSRLYIDNWNRLSPIQQDAIVNELALKGYRMERN